MTPSVFRLLITGGPCAGKSIALPSLKRHFERNGYTVICVPEAASSLIAAGLSPKTIPNTLFQSLQLDVQIKNEEDALQQAEASLCQTGRPVLIFFDRGVLDGEAFSRCDEFRKAAENHGINDRKALERYEAVFHMESLACIEGALYSTMNNPNRITSRTEARQSDFALRQLYGSHSDWNLIGGAVDQEEKTEHLIRAIESFLESRRH